jgi:hypothetical protein
METGLENVPEIIECDGYDSGSWPNISGVKFTGTVGPYDGNDEEKYQYTFNNLWNNKVTFCLELNGEEFEFLESFEIVKITTNELLVINSCFFHI